MGRPRQAGTLLACSLILGFGPYSNAILSACLARFANCARRRRQFFIGARICHARRFGSGEARGVGRRFLVATAYRVWVA